MWSRPPLYTGMFSLANIKIKMNSNTMKTNLHTFAVPASIVAGFLIGCSSTPTASDRTDPTAPSIAQVPPYDSASQRIYDPTHPGVDVHGQQRHITFTRNLEGQSNPPEPVSASAPPPEPEPVAAAVGAPAQREVLRRSDSVALNYTGTITDIDHATREMTLKGPEGRLETFVVDKKVQRFNEAKVGDKVSMDYILGYDAEVRKPTPEEERNPLVVLDTASTNTRGSGAPPEAHDKRRIRAVVTIEAMDRAAQTVTVKGPRGKHFVTRVADPSRLEQVNIGDTVLMTFTESTAISLKPAN